MPVAVLLVCTAVLAVVAVVAAVVAVRAARKVAAAPALPSPHEAVVGGPAMRTTSTLHLVPTDADHDDEPAEGEDDVAETVPVVAHVVDGRVVLTPTDRQVVDATLGRPLVRLSVVGAGLAHALRPESRDRIAGIVRREYRRRKRVRRKAARRAARTTTPGPAPQQDWLGTTSREDAS